jgi:hypothetical protein
MIRSLHSPRLTFSVLAGQRLGFGLEWTTSGQFALPQAQTFDRGSIGAAPGYILNMAIGYMDNQLRARTRKARVTIRLIEADA